MAAGLRAWVACALLLVTGLVAPEGTAFPLDELGQPLAGDPFNDAPENTSSPNAGPSGNESQPSGNGSAPRSGTNETGPPANQTHAPPSNETVPEGNATHEELGAPFGPAPPERPGGPGEAVSPWVWLSIALVSTGLFLTPVRRSLLLLLFSRLDDEEVARHPRRAALLELVRARPGISFESARRTLAWSRGSFEHHLQLLAARRLLHVVRTSSGTFLHLAGSRGPRVAVSLPDRILHLLRLQPGLRPVDLARRLKAHERTVRHHTRRLSRQGAIELVERGRDVFCYPTVAPTIRMPPPLPKSRSSAA